MFRFSEGRRLDRRRWHHLLHASYCYLGANFARFLRDPSCWWNINEENAEKSSWASAQLSNQLRYSERALYFLDLRRAHEAHSPTRPNPRMGWVWGPRTLDMGLLGPIGTQQCKHFENWITLCLDPVSSPYLGVIFHYFNQFGISY